MVPDSGSHISTDVPRPRSVSWLSKGLLDSLKSRKTVAFFNVLCVNRKAVSECSRDRALMGTSWCSASSNAGATMSGAGGAAGGCAGGVGVEVRFAWRTLAHLKSAGLTLRDSRSFSLPMNAGVASRKTTCPPVAAK